MKVSFLLALATAKRVDELQVLSCQVASHGPDMSLSYLLELWRKLNPRGNPFRCRF